MKGSRGSSEIDVGGLLNAVRSGNRHQFSRITASVANAFGDDTALHPHSKPPSSSKKLLLKVSSTYELNNRRKRETFLTGNEVVEVEEPLEEVEEVKEKEMTLEDMVRDLDDFSKNVMGDYDDLAEVRRRIAACRRGIDQQTVNTYKLKQNIQDLDDRNQDFLEGRPTDMKRSKSYGRLQTRTNSRKITAKSILARRG